MKITQVRNATIVIEYKGKHIIVDPMLAPKGILPRLRFLGSKKKNPTTELPKEFIEMEKQISHALITHCQKGHFDHLDSYGRKFLRDNKIITYSTKHDQKYLTSKRIDAQSLEKQDNFFDGRVTQIPAQHTKGYLYPLLEHGVGYYIELPHTPTLYIMGDTILTDTIKVFIKENQPDYIIAPTGIAKFDIGHPLLLTKTDILELCKISKGTIIANHMDALDHCRMTRDGLRELLGASEYLNKVIIPEDGQTIDIG